MTNWKAYIHRWTDDITLTDMRIKGTEKSFKSKRKKTAATNSYEKASSKSPIYQSKTETATLNEWSNKTTIQYPLFTLSAIHAYLNPIHLLKLLFNRENILLLLRFFFLLLFSVKTIYFRTTIIHTLANTLVHSQIHGYQCFCFCMYNSIVAN